MENDVLNNGWSHLPQDKPELIHRIQDEWTKLLCVIEPLNESEMTTCELGGWSIKDNLAHITAWEQFLRLHYLKKLPPHEVMGMDLDTFEKADEDGINALLFQHNKDRSITDIVSDFHHSHEQLVSYLKQHPFTDLMKPRFADDPEERPWILWVIGNTYEHYEEHRISIQRLITQIQREA